MTVSRASGAASCLRATAQSLRPSGRSAQPWRGQARRAASGARTRFGRPPARQLSEEHHGAAASGCAPPPPLPGPRSVRGARRRFRHAGQARDHQPLNLHRCQPGRPPCRLAHPPPASLSRESSSPPRAPISSCRLRHAGSAAAGRRRYGRAPSLTAELLPARLRAGPGRLNHLLCTLPVRFKFVFDAETNFALN